MIDVYIELEIVTSETNPNDTIKKRARVVRSEDICETPDSCGKVDIVIGDGEDAFTIRGDSMELVKVLNFVQCNKAPVSENQHSGGAW
jgi:hypothetical protein